MRISVARYAEVALPVHVFQTFTYELPLALRDEARVGARMLVPFGRQLLTGYIVALLEELDPAVELDPTEIRPAEELLDTESLLTSEVLEISRWIAEYYAAPWGEVLKAALPAGLNQSIEQIFVATSEGLDELVRISPARATTARAQLLQTIAAHSEISLRTLAKNGERPKLLRTLRQLERANWIRSAHRTLTAQTKVKRRKAVRLSPSIEHELEALEKPLSAAQARVIEALARSGGQLFFAQVLEDAEASASIVQTLERRGLVETFICEVRRDPLAHAKLPRVDEFHLTEPQLRALTEIEIALTKGEYAAFLLHGVTGSGKTEIYMRAMKAALENGRSAMMLVPEISLTPVSLVACARNSAIELRSFTLH
ncbi:MAG: DEAD/DEAH box helicase family protein [Pyrinomonadaceae bacterium]